MPQMKLKSLWAFYGDIPWIEASLTKKTLMQYLEIQNNPCTSHIINTLQFYFVHWQKKYMFIFIYINICILLKSFKNILIDYTIHKWLGTIFIQFICFPQSFIVSSYIFSRNTSSIYAITFWTNAQRNPYSTVSHP